MTARPSFRLAGAAGLAAGLTLGGSVLIAASTASAAPAEHVTICHALGTPDAADHGYVEIGPAETGTVRGHAAWDFKTHVPSANGHEADIIPPFTYSDQDGDHEFPGQNWDAGGEAILDNGCVAPEPTTPPESTTTTGTSTTSTSTTSTSTTTPPTSTTSTSTTTPPTSTTSTSTTAPPTSTTSTSTTTMPPTSTTTASSSTHMPPPVVPTNPAGPQTPGVVQTDGGPMGGDSGALLGALGIAALLGTMGAAGVVGNRAASRRH
ncbi:hypothetical protein [Janibacter sp. Soil728]|uniref:hypothetical protein n=1 Tax=Janibacter sp. Soil728 TaxID=1736393 RepID=UPI000A4D2EE4|nr:hypothetical protein [Janibacter sp. Soil728]